MPKHGIPRGEKSTAGGSNASPGTPGYEGQHRGEAGSDLPARGENVKDVDIRR